MAQVDAQTFIRLCKEAGRLCSFDLEATGLNGDYNAVLVVSVKPYKKKPIIFSGLPDDNETVTKKACEALADFDCWVSYYGKGYDVKMLRTSLLGCGAGYDVPIRHHIDLYYSVVAGKLNTSHRSQAHINAWLYPEDKLEAKKLQKMTVSAGVWKKVVSGDQKTRLEALKILSERCSRDTIGLEGQLDKTEYLIREVTR